MSKKKESWEVEYAKTDRSTCGTCYKSISKGALRIGHGTPSHHHDGLDVANYHYKCRISMVPNLEVLRGWYHLRWDDQKAVRSKFPNDPFVAKLNAATEQARQKYIDELWKIKDDLADSPLKGPQIKMIIEQNKSRVEKVPADSLLHRLADWLLLGRTGQCPTCKGFDVGYNSIDYKCYGHATEFTKCDWVGTSIERFQFIIPSELKDAQKKYLNSIKRSKDYPKTLIDYNAKKKEEEEEEEDEESDDDEEGEGKQQEEEEDKSDPDTDDETTTTTTTTASNGEEDPVPKNSELFGIVIIVAGTQKNLPLSPAVIKSLVNDHGGQVVEQVSKATVMISCSEEVEKKNPTKKVQEALDSIPILTVEWLENLVNRTGEGIELRKNEKAKQYLVGESKFDGPLYNTKYVAPKPTKQSEPTKKKKRGNDEEFKAKPIVVKNRARLGSDILKVDEDAGYGYTIYEKQDSVYGWITHNVMLNRVDIEEGFNKFYKIQLLQKGSNYFVLTKWGRIGKTFGTKLDNSPGRSISSAIDIFSERFHYFTGVNWDDHHQFQKKPGKYFMVTLDDGWDDEEGNQQIGQLLKKTRGDGSQLTQSLENSEASLPQRTQDLIRLMFDSEMMKKQLASMNVDVNKMPLGKIKTSQIMQGYKVLSEIQDHLAKDPVPQALLKDCTNRFYTLIPHNFGSGDPVLINSTLLLKDKMSLIEALIDIDIANNLKKQTANEEGNIIDNYYKSLKTNLAPLDKDSDTYKQLVKYATNSHDAKQFRFGITVEDIFDVEREGEKDRFTPWEKNNNKLLLWHGSRLTNWIGILSTGLRIAPKEAPSTGYRFGKGIYLADCISKSASYCFTSKENPTALMILCEAAMGRMNELKHDKYMEKPPTGTDSTKALGMAAPDPSQNTKILDDVTLPIGPIKSTGLSTSCTHNEFIVYDVSQVKIKYILRVNIKN